MPPLTAQQKITVNQFMALTGTQEKTAQKLLKATGWKLDLAANSFFESNGAAAPVSKGQDVLGKLFEKYREPTDDKDTITVNGMMGYFNDLDVNMENAEVLVAAELVQAPTMGLITKEGFVNGWSAVGCDTIAKQKAYIRGQIKQLSSDMTLLKRVYRHTFAFAKEKDQKALSKEMAVIYWELLFREPSKVWTTPSTNWIAMWLNFLDTKWTKSVNKDMWNQTFEFFLKTMQDETLSFWSEDSAWPGVIDEFVAHVKEQRGDLPDSMETD